MAGPVYISPAAVGFAVIVFVIAVWVFARLARDIIALGGKVRSAEYDLSELLMSFVFVGFFGFVLMSAIRRQGQAAHPLSVDAVLPNSYLFIILAAGILCFLQFARRLPMREMLGLDRLSPLATAGWAVGLIFAAMPLAGAANYLTVYALHGLAEPQPLVDLFARMARVHDYGALAKIGLAAVVVQPICEEIIFRGFFYGVWKRFIGFLPAGFLASVVFAAGHGSITALGGLFVLAICLNLAYERTGSLLVPIGMHALFNFSSLLVIFLQAQAPLPS